MPAAKAGAMIDPSDHSMVMTCLDEPASGAECTSNCRCCGSSGVSGMSHPARTTTKHAAKPSLPGKGHPERWEDGKLLQPDPGRRRVVVRVEVREHVLGVVGVHQAQEGRHGHPTDAPASCDAQVDARSQRQPFGVALAALELREVVGLELAQD